jgi:hypothetical protein
MGRQEMTINVAIRRLHNRGVAISDIAETYSLAESKVESILNINKMANNNLITNAQKAQVKKLKRQGETHKVIANEVNISETSVGRILNPKSRNQKVAVSASKPKTITKQVKVKNPVSKSRFRLFWGAIEIVKETA